MNLVDKVNFNIMDFEKINNSTKEQMETGIPSTTENTQSSPEKPLPKIECPERQETINEALRKLEWAFKTLEINNWQLPKIKIEFTPEPTEPPSLGRVEVLGDEIIILFDQRFSTTETETELVKSLQESGRDYPGMEQTLKHELAHIAMWSITGLEKQPATRLIDEGWARMVEDTSDLLPTTEAKASIRRGLKEETVLYERCLDFQNPIIHGELKLNNAEYETGKALLLWVHEKFGKDKMLELIRKSPSQESRNDNSEFTQAKINSDLHTTTPEYATIMLAYNLKDADYEETKMKLRGWEGKQFATALLEVTKLKNLEDVKQEFLNWINE